MRIARRGFLQGGLAASVAMALPWPAAADEGAGFAPRPGAWRKFAVTTRLEIAGAGGPARAWVPLPSVRAADWMLPLGNAWTGNAAAADVARDADYGAEMLAAEWKAGETAPVLEVTSRFAVRDRSIDLGAPGTPAPLSTAERRLYTAATELLPTDGLVAETAQRITAGKSGDLARARAIYEWIVDNTYRNPKTRGCGLGDIASLLATGDLGGKCADLNALYVGLARASGLPARDVYGIRVAPSAFGYKSLGANSPGITKAQHCRAEVWLDGFGWVPVDPADVRKVMLEEPPGNRPIDDAKVVAARKALFGSWETNWLAYNTAHDVALPGSDGPRLGFLMYPQAETAAGRLDCLDAGSFRYTITAAAA